MDDRPNVKHKTIHLFEQHTGENLQDLKLGNDFFGMTSKVQSAKGKINKLDLIKIKNFVLWEPM